MRKWGVLITAFYLLALVFFVTPVAMSLANSDGKSLLQYVGILISEPGVHGVLWAWIALLVTAQALLFFVSVDTTHKRLLPRRRTALSVTAITVAVGLLTFSAILSVLIAFMDDDAEVLNSSLMLLLSPITFWLIWGIVFYLYREQVSARVDRAVNWLLAGSVLQLLIVVPCHVIVRQRGDCSAPGVTAFGIATGIAVMLMAFGPSIIFLYQKRLRGYRKEQART